MRIGFYSTVFCGWSYGEVGANSMPLCVECLAFHYSNVECITNDQRRDLAPMAARNLVEMEQKGFLAVEHLFREAFGISIGGLLRDFGVDQNEDCLEVLEGRGD